MRVSRCAELWIINTSLLADAHHLRWKYTWLFILSRKATVFSCLKKRATWEALTLSYDISEERQPCLAPYEVSRRLIQTWEWVKSSGVLNHLTHLTDTKYSTLNRLTNYFVMNSRNISIELQISWSARDFYYVDVKCPRVETDCRKHFSVNRVLI